MTRDPHGDLIDHERRIKALEERVGKLEGGSSPYRAPAMPYFVGVGRTGCTCPKRETAMCQNFLCPRKSNALEVRR